MSSYQSMGGHYREAGGVQHHHLLEMEVVMPLEEATSIIISNGEEVEEAGEVTMVVVVVVVVGMIVGSLKEVAVEIKSGGGNRTEVYNDKSIDNSKPMSIQGRPKGQTVQ
jgi:hypothetical protein